MRSDYGLYGVAIICFIIAGAIAAADIPGYKIAETNGIVVFMVFLVIGIISAAVGYSARPKAMIPPKQPTPTLATPPKETPTPVTPPHEEMHPPTPLPVEEVTAEAPPPQEAQPSQTQPIVTPTEPEQPVEIAEEEKPKTKPVRRRRKKAQS